MRWGSSSIVPIVIFASSACTRFDADSAPDAGADAGVVSEGPVGDGAVDKPEPKVVTCGAAASFCEDFDGALSITDVLSRFTAGNGEGNLSLFKYGANQGLRATLGPGETVATLIHQSANKRPAEVIVEVDVRPQKVAGPIGLFSLDYWSRLPPTNRFLKGLGVVVRADGRVSLDAGANKIDTGFTMTTGQWHKLRLIAPTGVARADLEIDGNRYTNTQVYLDGAVGEFQLAFGPYLEIATGSEQSVEYDNLRVSAR